MKTNIRNKLVPVFLKTLFIISIVSFLGIILCLYFARASNFEYSDLRLSRNHRDILVLWLPVPILLSLTGTLKRKYGREGNTIRLIFTLIAAIVSFIYALAVILDI